jgi:gliding motility-associated lipoprotein GldD
MKFIKSALAIVCLILLAACVNRDYSPKPRGFFRIDFPEKSYQSYQTDCPFTFEYPKYATIEADRTSDAQSCWINVQFPQFKGTLHLSYQPITSRQNFMELVEDARTFAFKHTIKATAIDEGIIHYPEHRIHGIFYTIDGNAASSLQFFLTDSSKNYLRGALYFNEEPKLDSIQPVLTFIKKDIDVLIKSLRWNN